MIHKQRLDYLVFLFFSKINVKNNLLYDKQKTFFIKEKHCEIKKYYNDTYYVKENLFYSNNQI